VYLGAKRRYINTLTFLFLLVSGHRSALCGTVDEIIDSYSRTFASKLQFCEIFRHMLSPIRLSSVCNGRAPYSAG